MRRLLLSLCLVVACKKAQHDPPAPAPEPVAKPAPSPTKPATKWLAIPALGIEVEAPACAELTPIDAGSFGVGPDTPACPIEFPGVVFTTTLEHIAPTLEEQLAYIATDPTPPAVTRKDKTASGWIVEWTHPATADSPARPGFNERYHLGGKDFACIAYGTYSADQMRVLAAICTSAREKH